MPSLVNIQSLVNGGSRWYSWVIMAFPLGSEGSRIPLLKGFMLDPVIRICGLPLSKYLYLTSLGNSAWLNLVDVVVAAPILPVLGWLVIFF